MIIHDFCHFCTVKPNSIILEKELHKSVIEIDSCAQKVVVFYRGALKLTLCICGFPSGRVCYQRDYPVQPM